MGSLRSDCERMSWQPPPPPPGPGYPPQQGYPPQYPPQQPHPGYQQPPMAPPPVVTAPPPPPAQQMMNNTTIINNTPAPAAPSPIVVIEQKKTEQKQHVPPAPQNDGTCGCLLILLVLAGIGVFLGVYIPSRDGESDAEPQCASSKDCLGLPTGICDYSTNTCIDCKDIGYTELQCTMYGFSSYETREECNDYCAPFDRAVALNETTSGAAQPALAFIILLIAIFFC